MKLSNEAKKLKSAYYKEWRRKNRDKIKQYDINYWEKQADPVGAEVRQLSKAGLSQRAIAEKLDISLGAVNKILNAEENTE